VVESLTKKKRGGENLTFKRDDGASLSLKERDESGKVCLETPICPL
jgi:hypothetical protein